MSEPAKIPDWERIQKKTFTKWINTHLKKKWGADHLIDDVITGWETGINLMRLTVALYSENEKNPEQAVSMPKLKAKEMEPKNKIQKITNLNTAIDLLKKAGVAMRGVSAENLHDHEDRDKPVVLGMVFMIILDYSARGFGGAASEVKRALLEWVNKKTDGYEKVNPPGVKNFTSDWNNGLAWCALIHRHRPDLLNYDECLGKTNAENLELAFSVAENDLDIPRLLDVEDMDVAKPDEKSVITYTMEYFLRFASEGLKENAAKQAADWLKFLREIQERKNDYERRARVLVNWTKSTRKAWDACDFGTTQEEAIAAFNGLRTFVTETKPPQEGEKMDLEGLYVEIQQTLKINGLAPFTPSEDVTPAQIEKSFTRMAEDQATHGTSIRENRFKFMEKEDDSAGEEIMAQIDESFKRYDTNDSQTLNKKEFNAACMEMGIALKTDDEKDALFLQISAGQEEMSFDQYKAWMVPRLVVSLGDPESVKNAFKTMADGRDGITEAQMNLLAPEDKAYMLEHMNKLDNGSYDFAGFVTEMML